MPLTRARGRTALVPTPARRPARPVALAGLLVWVLTSLVPAAGASASGPAAPDGRLHLVVLDGPGTAARAPARRADARARIRRELDALRERVGAPEPAYRWTTALAGMALELDQTQARRLAGDPRVALVEPDRVRRLAGLGTGAPVATSVAPDSGGPRSGGRGVVVAVVDSGLDPDLPSFAATPGQGPRPRGAAAACPGGTDWPSDRCEGKVVAARWFVEGFGRDSLRTGASLSPVDDEGHGTAVAALAVGVAQVPVRQDGRRVGTAGGSAPDARLAVYKACWTAPDPDRDGCASSDLVAAVDRATADGVDVLSLAAGGPSDLDALELALLGAAEADVVVLAAAGNDARGSWAAHPSPWVTTVGGAQGPTPRGALRLGDGPVLHGASASTRRVSGRLVHAVEARRPGVARTTARTCEPGSLDADRVADRVVLCERGQVGRVDKSGTVALAGGAGMVLLDDTRRGAVADLHAVPTVHLAAEATARLRTWLRTRERPRVRMRPDGAAPGRGLAPFTPPGDPTGAVLKPDVLAPATGAPAPLPDARTVQGAPAWTVVTGTSAATARAAGAAAALRARRPGWSATQVRSALATGARALPGAPTSLRSGSGLVDAGRAARSRLTVPETSADYRAWLEGRRRWLNPPSVLLPGTRTTAVRTLRSSAPSVSTFSAETRGLGPAVRVEPASVRLAPGERARFRVSTGPPGTRRATGAGVVLWRGEDGSTARVPVVVTR